MGFCMFCMVCEGEGDCWASRLAARPLQPGLMVRVVQPQGPPFFGVVRRKPTRGVTHWFVDVLITLTEDDKSWRPTTRQEPYSTLTATGVDCTCVTLVPEEAVTPGLSQLQDDFLRLLWRWDRFADKDGRRFDVGAQVTRHGSETLWTVEGCEGEFIIVGTPTVHGLRCYPADVKLVDENQP